MATDSVSFFWQCTVLTVQKAFLASDCVVYRCQGMLKNTLRISCSMCCELKGDSTRRELRGRGQLHFSTVKTLFG